MANVDRSRDKISTELSYEKELLDFCWDPTYNQFAGANGDESATGSAGGNSAAGAGDDERYAADQLGARRDGSPDS